MQEVPTSMDEHCTAEFVGGGFDQIPEQPDNTMPPTMNLPPPVSVAREVPNPALQVPAMNIRQDSSIIQAAKDAWPAIEWVFMWFVTAWYSVLILIPAIKKYLSFEQLLTETPIVSMAGVIVLAMWVYRRLGKTFLKWWNVGVIFMITGM